MILDATTKSIQVVLAAASLSAASTVTASYADMTLTQLLGGNNTVSTNGTTAVTAVAAPGASTQRQIKYLSVYNADTANVTATVQLNNNGTIVPMCKVTLSPGQTLQYSSNDGFEVVAQTTPFSDAPSFKNKIINGNFDWWQRGTSRAAGVGQFYIADRWRDNSNGTTVAASQQAFAAGQTAVPGEPAFFHRSVVASIAGAGNFAVLQQVVESVRTLAGQNAALSFWAKADASKNMAVEMSQNFGTGGSPSTGVNFGVTTCALTVNWQKFTIPLSVPSISGKTLGTGANDGLQVGFWFDAGSTYNSDSNSLGQQSGTFDIAQVQLEYGTAVTAFEQRPPETELALCQRYCFSTGPIAYGGAFALGHQINATSAIAMFNTPVTMRAQPTLSFIGTIGWTGDGTTNTVNPSLAVGYNNQMLLLFGISGATAGRAGYASPNTAGSNPATLILSAEY